MKYFSQNQSTREWSTIMFAPDTNKIRIYNCTSKVQSQDKIYSVSLMHNNESLTNWYSMISSVQAQLEIWHTSTSLLRPFFYRDIIETALRVGNINKDTPFVVCINILSLCFVAWRGNHTLSFGYYKENENDALIKNDDEKETKDFESRLFFAPFGRLLFVWEPNVDISNFNFSSKPNETERNCSILNQTLLLLYHSYTSNVKSKNHDNFYTDDEEDDDDEILCEDHDEEDKIEKMKNVMKTNMNEKTMKQMNTAIKEEENKRHGKCNKNQTKEEKEFH